MFGVASVFWLGLLASTGVHAGVNDMTLTLFDGPEFAQLNPRCLDGSAPGLYFRPATAAENNTKFVIFFEGGGWCCTLEDCAGRALSVIGSSKDWLPTTNDTDGIMSNNETQNPNFSTWNTVWVPYCDGTSFSGNQATPIMSASQKPIYYRGRANMQAVVYALLYKFGMQSATHVLMDGGSAGGLTVLLHADFFASFLPPTTTFGAVGDAGWFRPDITKDNLNYTGSMRTMFSVSNATTNAACEAANAADPAACTFSPVVFPYVKSKMFVLEAAYDSFQLRNILGFQCATYQQPLSSCSAADNATLEAYGTSMRTSIRAALTSTPHHAATAGAFVSSCITHVQGVYNEEHVQWLQPAAGSTPHDAISTWFFENTTVSFIEDCPFPCNPACQMFT